MIESGQIVAMIEHWLSTPPNSYFGQTYGADIRSILLQELSTDKADEMLAKIRRDIPLLNRLGEHELSIVSEQVGHDRLKIYLLVNNAPIPIGESKPETLSQDYYDIRSQ